MKKPRYDVCTWDGELEKFTPQKGVRCRNLSIHGVRLALKALRGMGYSCHRRREAFNVAFTLVVARLVMR